MRLVVLVPLVACVHSVEVLGLTRLVLLVEPVHLYSSLPLSAWLTAAALICKPYLGALTPLETGVHPDEMLGLARNLPISLSQNTVHRLCMRHTSFCQYTYRLQQRRVI